MNKEIDLPTTKMVQEYINKFDKDDELVVVENVLSELFRKYPNNQDLCDVLIKVATINSLYGTNIYALAKVAKHILNQNIDSKLQEGSLVVIKEISHITIDGKTRNNYSFASKYCHWHRPEYYPIYDSYIGQLLWAYRNQDGFSIFKQAELRQYPQYKEIVENFRKYYALTEFSFKELDKFLWLYGKEIFKNTL